MVCGRLWLKIKRLLGQKLLLDVRLLWLLHLWGLGCNETRLVSGDHGEVELRDGILVLIMRFFHEDALREAIRLARLLVLLVTINDILLPRRVRIIHIWQNWLEITSIFGGYRHWLLDLL